MRITAKLAGCMTTIATSLAALFSEMLAVPFDIARYQYANAVRLGLLKPSLIASARFGRTLSTLERCTLGPLARRY